MTSIPSIKGFYDILPTQTALWFQLEDTARDVFAQYGYQNIRLPLVETSDLFVRSVGAHSDIVEKEMYAWVDALNGDRLSLRPEGTAGCVRAVIEHNLTYNGAVRLWYSGAMFRHENVQKGRQRQFHQLGGEAFGFAAPLVDAEQMLLLARLWAALGVQDVELQLNSIGDSHERAVYRTKLVAYFERYADILDADSQRRLTTNPLRILDSKNPHMQDLIAQAPQLVDDLGAESRSHFEQVCAYLDDAGVAYRLNPRLVRGLDYYNRTVFEWVTSALGAQGTIAGGGRYDGLVAVLGGKPTPACGFAIGLERVLMLLEQNQSLPSTPPDVYVVSVGEAATKLAMQVSESLRAAQFMVLVDGSGGRFKAQMKKADKSDATLALIIGEDEVAQSVVTIKHLRGGDQQRCAVADLLDTVKEVLPNHLHGRIAVLRGARKLV